MPFDDGVVLAGESSSWANLGHGLGRVCPLGRLCGHACRLESMAHTPRAPTRPPQLATAAAHGSRRAGRVPGACDARAGARMWCVVLPFNWPAASPYLCNLDATTDTCTRI